MEWQTFVAILGTIVGIIGGIAALRRNHKHDAQEEGHNNGVILTELGFIKAGVEDIKTEQREQRKINTEMYSRISAVEASCKQAHKRLDMLNEKGV